MPQVASSQLWRTLFGSEEFLPFPCMHSSNPAELHPSQAICYSEFFKKKLKSKLEVRCGQPDSNTYLPKTFVFSKAYQFALYPLHYTDLQKLGDLAIYLATRASSASATRRTLGEGFEGTLNPGITVLSEVLDSNFFMPLRHLRRWRSGIKKLLSST